MVSSSRSVTFQIRTIVYDIKAASWSGSIILWEPDCSIQATRAVSSHLGNQKLNQTTPKAAYLCSVLIRCLSV